MRRGLSESFDAQTQTQCFPESLKVASVHVLLEKAFVGKDLKLFYNTLRALGWTSRNFDDFTMDGCPTAKKPP